MQDRTAKEASPFISISQERDQIGRLPLQIYSLQFMYDEAARVGGHKWDYIEKDNHDLNSKVDCTPCVQSWV